MNNQQSAKFAAKLQAMKDSTKDTNSCDLEDTLKTFIKSETGFCGEEDNELHKSSVNIDLGKFREEQPITAL